MTKATCRRRTTISRHDLKTKHSGSNFASYAIQDITLPSVHVHSESLPTCTQVERASVWLGSRRVRGLPGHKTHREDL